MALQVLYTGGYRDSLGTLADADFTRNNNAGNEAGTWTNDLIDEDTPRGALAGHIAVVTDDSEYGVFDLAKGIVANTRRPKGIFILDAASNSFENTPAVGSLKLAVLSGSSVVKLDVYETHDVTTSPDDAITYAAGDALFVSDNGLLTNVQAGNATSWTTAIGQVLHAPGSDNFMTVELFL